LEIVRENVSKFPSLQQRLTEKTLVLGIFTKCEKATTHAHFLSARSERSKRPYWKTATIIRISTPFLVCWGI